MAYFTLSSYKLKASPLSVFEALRNERNAFFLDSSMVSASRGRYSFLGANPFLLLKAKGKIPFAPLRAALDKYRFQLPKEYPPFCAGAVGYLSYDLGFLLEDKLKKWRADELGIPEAFFGFYNSSVVIDNLKKRLYIFTAGFPEKRYGLQKALCRDNLKKIKKLLLNRAASFAEGARAGAHAKEVESNFSRQEYIAAIKKAKRYIREGDIYQLNLSQRFQAETRLAAAEIYKRLRKLSPSFFSAYLDAGDFQVISSSPERFLQLSGDKVVTRPMKGTRPRRVKKTEDLRIKGELLKSKKDKAELMMIVDLERNDLGRVCEYGSIKVDRLREVERYSTVYQTTATISGRLHRNKDRIDLLRAAFPGGSITGCPKIRAMQIIEELEPHRRSIYTGCLGYLSFSGQMDFNILIRTILKKGSEVYFGAGGGIVADSDPEDEYEETLVKAGAMMKAVA